MKFGCYILVIENHMKRIPGYHFDFGWGNGYVLLPHNHPFYNKHYDDIDVNVHGGLTYSNKFESNNFMRWIENLKIDGDVTLENFKKFENYWMIGFDTNHAGDSLDSCPKYYVMNEARNLLDQCIEDKIEGINKYKTIYIRKSKLKKINAIDKKE